MADVPAVATQAQVASPAPDTYDPEVPLSLVTKRISVLWAGNRWYDGTVTEYNQTTDKFFIVYDDNDRRWYKLPGERTFRVIGTQLIYHAEAQESSAFRAAFVPYVSKFLNSNTNVTFHLKLDPEAVEPGEVVVVRGSLSQLGSWGAGIPLARSDRYPGVWSVKVGLPFAHEEACSAGIFEYKFAIEVPGDKAVLEGGVNHRPTRCYSHFYGTFQPDSAHGRRFKNAKKATGVFGEFLRQEVELLLQHGSATEFMERLHGLRAAFPDVSRTTVEDLLDSLSDDPAFLASLNTTTMLAVIAAAGSFGISSAEKPKQQNNWDAYGVWAPSAPPPYPKPRKWCYWVLQNLNVEHGCMLELKAVLGPNYGWVSLGVREAAERISYDGPFQWLRVVPFLETHNSLPTTWATAKNSKKAVKDFADFVPEVRALAASAFEMAKNEPREEKKGDVPDGDKEKAKEAPKDPLPLFLAKSWLRALVRAAPTIQALSALFEKEAGLQVHSSFLLPEVADWVFGAEWDDIKEMEVLLTLVRDVPSLRGPQIGAALLRNVHSDKAKLSDSVLALIQLCCETSGEIDFTPLESAAKEWVRRNHAHEPENKEEKNKDKEYTYSLFGGYKEPQKKKPPTKDEVAKKRAEALALAVTRVDSLLRIPYFDSRSQGLLFELGRCYFLKGEPSAVLVAICAFGAKGLQTYSPHIQQFLTTRAVQLIQESVPGLDAEKLDSFVALIEGNLSKASELNHILLHAVAETAGGAIPSLESVLRWHLLWRRVITNYQKQEGTQLTSMLQHINALLGATATAIADCSVQLQVLHVVQRFTQPFLGLLELFKSKALTSGVLAQRVQTLTTFDQTLAELKCYVTFFCNCGVPIDCQQLLKRVEDLNVRYDRLTLSEVENHFNDLKALYGSSMSWLFRLRSSAIFLTLWREEGSLEASKPAESKSPLFTPGSLFSSNSPPSSPFSLNGNVPPAPPLLNLADILEHKGPQSEAPQDDVLVHTLTQQRVLSALIPSVKRTWNKLMHSVKDRSITIAELQRRFAGLKSDEEYRQELALLAQTGGEAEEKDQEWVDTCFQQLKDFSLLVHMQQWLPALIRVRELMSPLLTTAASEDHYFAQLNALLATQKTNWDAQKLGTLSGLVAPLKNQFREFSEQQLVFLTSLSECDGLVKWLLNHKSTDEFNRLLQVCRPCTDEPRLLSSIASLVQIRTLLLQLLYVKAPYPGLSDFLKYFSEGVDLGGDDAFWHLKNIQASFDGLLEVFEKQTRSPGIKSCYDVRDIAQLGELVFKATADNGKVLVLELKSREEPKPGDPPLPVRVEPLEYLLDLRSKLMMTEIPEALEAEMKISALVETFVLQLQVWCEMRDELIRLYTSGHFDYQEGFTLRLKFKSDGLKTLQAELAKLKKDLLDWQSMVKAARDKHYFLNYYTMREILRFTRILNNTLNDKEVVETPKAPVVVVAESKKKEAPPPPPKKAPTTWTCPRCTLENGILAPECGVCEGPRPDEFTPSFARAKPEGEGKVAMEEVAPPLDMLTEMVGLLHLGSSTINAEKVVPLMDDWAAHHQKGKDSTGDVLYQLGKLLDSILGSQHELRRIPLPSEKSANRADMLISVKSEERAIPVWVACAENPNKVIDVVLSVYVRRARLPAPGEILFCTSETTLEDVELLFRRFIVAQSHGRGDLVFCVADVHELSYTMQVAVVERLRGLLSEHGTSSAASLVIVSGKPRQVLLNSLSAQSIELPPLDEDALRAACQHAAMKHCGETLCVNSSINGGGKTHYIMKLVGQRQSEGERIVYRRVPIRESSTAATIVNRLSTFTRPIQDGYSNTSNAFHVDIGHIIPVSCNTLMFELLIVGVLKNKNTCQVYHRNSSDAFLLEIPNSTNGVTARALRFSSLLPSHSVTVGPEETDMSRPIFTDAACTKISAPEYSELSFVCKFLRAHRQGKFRPGDTFDPDWDPWVDAEISPAECFNLINQVCPSDGAPSYLLFHNFLAFMNTAFAGMSQYPMFNAYILSQQPGLETLKDVFIGLLVETSKDFSVRNVPRGKQFTSGVASPLKGPVHPADSSDLPPQFGIVRTASMEFREAAQRGEQPLVRQMSNDLATRFGKMVSWEGSEHPIVLWYYSNRGQEVDGLNILSLNPRFLDRYIRRDLKHALSMQNLNFEFDWSSLKSEQGIDILRKVEGFNMYNSRSKLKVDPIDPTYVITVDNLLKMLSIQMRLKNNLPVVIMGETGCGKSSLIRQLCAIIKAPLRTLNIHGGMEDTDIMTWMNGCIAEAQSASSSDRIVVFLDEVNTCNCMGLFKEIVCDRSMNGRPIPSNIKIIAACNPYRLKQGIGAQEENLAGLVFDHHVNVHGENVGTGITDPLKNLVYRVHPLPESMIDCVFDFGSLSPETERLYIKAMLRRQLAIYVSKEEAAGEVRKKDEKKEGTPAAPISPSSSSSNSRPPPSPVRGPEVSPENLTGRRRNLESILRGFRRNKEPAAPTAIRPRPMTPAEIRAQAEQEARDARAAQVAADEAMLHAELEDGLVNEVHKGFFETRVTLTDFGEFVEVFAEIICASQEFVRTLHGGERSVVSLRDVARCLRVYRWFGEHFATRKNAPWTLEDFCSVKPNATAHIRKAVILSISYCYHARLPRDHRRQFRKHVCDAWKNLQAPVREARQFAGGYGFFGQPVYGPRSTFLDMNPKEFEVVLRDVQSDFVQQMNLGEGIALNEALLENLFMILVSILNRVPIFVIGKPGSSKSLAMGLIQSNLNGDASENEFLRSLPAVEVFSYQCSPLSTSQGIEQAFEAADRYKKEAPNTIVVVLLDEVGLAEQSPHLPLKVLHKVLDEGGDTTLVGISNWALDPAKMNRAVHLYRPAPTVEDLSATAEGMVRSANLKGYLKSLAHAYSEVYLGQKRADFWGLREFYSTVRHINRELQQAMRPLDEPMIMTAVMRNFGGRPRELENVLSIFFRNLGLTLANVPRVGITELVRQNLASPEARHLMLLTKNNAALGLLFDQKLLAHDKTEVIFGSDFPLDQTDLQICLNIQRVKLCMAEGITVVLVHCESLFESLYDLLNQHYTEYGGQLYVRLAFGTHSRLCPVHRAFRVVVVVEKNEAYTRLAPPLLNRFEKQVMERHHLLDQEHSELVRRLKAFAFLLATDNAKGEQSEAEMQANIKSLRSSFCGYHHDMFSSLAQSVHTEESDLDSRRIEAMHRLLYIATPEAVCRVVASGRHKTLEEEHGIDVLDLYFKKQQHSDLKAFCATALDMWSDGFGSQIVALTFSTLSSRADLALNGLPQVNTVTLTVLHELSSERDLNQSVNDFFEGCSAGSVFMLQCDPLAASIRRIEHARYVCENARARFLKKRRDANLPVPVGVHVILLVHLPRNELSYCFDFDLRWRFVFLDSLEASSQGGLPDIPSMLGHNMPEIVAGLDLHKVLLANFRTAMSRLVYLHERTNEDVRLQIMFLLNLLKTDSELIERVKGAIAEMVRRSSQSLDIMAAAQQDQTLVLAGTFQGALHRQISATVASHFALLLAHMDRNQGLYMVDANNAGARIRQLWLSLFERSIADMDLGSHITSPFQVHEVHSDGIGLPFKARFPFSFFLINLIESLRPSVEGLSAAKAEEQLQQQLTILGFKHGLATRLPISLMKRYAHDFTCMVAPHFPKLDKQTQADMLWRVLTLHSGGTAPRTLSAVHTRYWHCERTLHSYFQLVDAVQACSAPMLSRLNHSLVFGPSLDCTMVQVCLNALAPQSQGWVDSIDFSRWMGMVQLARPTISSLLSDRGLADIGCIEEEPEDESKADEEVEENVSEAKGESKVAGEGKEEKKSTGELKTSETVVLRAREDKRDPTSPRSPPRPPPQGTAKVTDVVVAWEKMLLAFTFIRDIAAPLKIQPALALSTLDQLKDLELRTQATFRVLIRMFSDLNRSYSRQGQTVECDMCLQIPVNPVRFCDEANCRRLVCKRCAEDYLSSEAYLKGGQTCFWCRRPATNYTIIQADTKLVDKSRDMEEQLQAVASRFMEFFIFDFCFGCGTNSKVELTLLTDFVMLLARKKLHGATEQYFIDVVPSDAARVALLRALLQLSDPASREHVNTLILGELVASFQSYGHLDNPIGIVYASVQEEMVVQSGLNNLAAAASACDGVDLSHLTNIQKSGVREVLSTIAVIRRIIVIFANALCEVVDPPNGSVSKYTFPQVEACQVKLERILSAKGPSPHLLRSLQMFLLKNLERGRGVSFVRSALSQAPLSKGGWLQKWKATGETGLLRFLGENKLPRHNPFKALPFFPQIHRSLTVAMAPSGSDFAPLEATLHKLMGSSGSAQGGIQGALLAALFHECNLLNVLSDVAAVTKQRLEQVQQWVEKARCLDAWPAPVRQLLCFFAGSPRTKLPPSMNRVLMLTPQSSPEHISSVRLLAHLAAQSLNAGAGSPVLLGFFNTLIFSPELLVNTYFPVQPEDSTAMAARVLGGRWYTCPNGHAYYVDNCGRPTVIQKCATCGVDIGGTDHNLINTNRDLDSNLVGNTEYSQVSKIKDQSAPGYCLRTAAEESNPFESARELAATSNRVVRYLLHAGMCLSYLAQGAKWPKALLNPAFCTTNDPAKFFAEHVESDLQILQKMVRKSSDDLILLLHMTVVASESPESEAPPQVAPSSPVIAPLGAGAGGGRAELLARILAARRQVQNGQPVVRPATWAVLHQSDDRQSWEAEFKRLCIDPSFGSDLKEDPVQRATKMFSKEGEEEDGVFTSELLERLDLSTLQVEVRQVSLPALWRFRQSFNLMDFGMELSLNPANEETYPILSAFLTQEPQLRALRHLTSVLEWQNLLIGKYNRSLSHSAATTLTVADVLNSVMDKSRWRAAFDGFKHAWNSSWQYVERFGCLRIPPMYKGLVISESIPIAFCMPSEKDEGICPLALVRYLGEKHNTFVERVDEVLLLRGEEVQRASSRQNVVSSKYFTQAHSLSYELQGGFASFVEKQCVRLSNLGKVEYDFANAERYLLDVVLSGKPLLDLVVRMIQYSDDVVASSVLLKQKVRQEPLPKSIQQKILREIGTPAKSHACLELLETCVSFLQATGGSAIQRLNVGDRLLGEYARSVLLLDADFGSATVSSEVKLMHIDSLWKLLRDTSIVDPFANVRPKFKEHLDIDPTLQQAFKAMGASNIEVLLPLFKDFITSYLSEDVMSAASTVKENLGFWEYQDVFLSDLPWFEQHFPATVLMKHVVALFHIMEASVAE